MTNQNYSKTSSVDVIHALIKTSHYIQREFEASIASLDMPFQISGPRLRLLLKVSESGKIRMSELATKLGIKARTVTDFVDALEQEKLLIRLPDPIDRRATLIQLTDNAKDQILKVQSCEKEAADILLKNLSQEQRENLLNLLLGLTNYNEVQCSFDE